MSYTLTEHFDQSKLYHLLNNKDEYGAIITKNEDLLKKYLYKSRNNKISVHYKQKNKGRYYADKQLSLQMIPSIIRKTISNNFYIDIDISNCHPVILSHICKKNNIKCDNLNKYILNRDIILNRVSKLNNISKKEIKKIFLSLLNGGNKDYNKLDIKGDDIINYKNELLNIHNELSNLNESKFKNNIERRKRINKDYNHSASLCNLLICEIENKILIDMYKYFGQPENCVLVFDGLMLDKTKKYDVEGCIKFITEKYKIDNFNIVEKSMNDNILNIPDDIIPYNNFSLNYFSDFRNLLNKDVYLEWVEEWMNNSLKLIENSGKFYFITKEKKEIQKENNNIITEQWQIRNKIKSFMDSLNVNCFILNKNFDYNFYNEYLLMDDKEKKKYKNDITIRKYLYTSLDDSKNGFLKNHIMNRTIDSYNSMDYYPKLREQNIKLIDTFNSFCYFPFDNDNKYNDFDFINSRFYNHLKTDFFNNDQDEFNHFLDHIADIIQDPSNIKGTSHLFYSKQGTGKGMLLYFMERLLGVNNTLTVLNIDNYFDSNFNSQNCNKLLKIFEEMSERGAGYKNHNRLKAEITSKMERIEPKGVDAYHNRHCARYWFFSNNENCLFIESDDRRSSLHKVSSVHANNYDYFKPIWKDIDNDDFVNSAFQFFKNRKYDYKNVINSFLTDYKRDQKLANINSVYKFSLDFIQNNFNKIVNEDYFISVDDLKNKYNLYCQDNNIKSNINTLNKYLEKINIIKKQRQVNNRKKYYYVFNTYDINNKFIEMFKDNEFKFKFMDNDFRCDKNNVVSFNNYQSDFLD